LKLGDRVHNRYPDHTSPETISVLETQIDDLNPAVGYVFEHYLPVLDVFTQAIGMKSRQVLLTVICHPKQLLSCEAVLFRETSTLGIRRLIQQRHFVA